MVNFNYVSLPKFVQSRKVLLMSAACVSNFRSFWSFPTNSIWDIFMRQPVKQIAYKCCIIFAKLNFSTEYSVLILSLRCIHWKYKTAVIPRCYKKYIVYAARPITASGRRSESNYVSLLWRPSWRLERAYRRPFSTVFGEFEPKNVVGHRVDPKQALPYATTRTLSQLCAKIHPRVTSVSESGEKVKIKKRPIIACISPGAHLRPIGTNFGLRVRLLHIINYAKFYRNRLRGLDSVRVEVWPFPLDCDVAVNTAWN